MTGVPSYSTTASENVNANTGINWDEGMPPASVNNSARQNMADVRSQWNDASYFQYGAGSKTVAAVYASSTSVTFTGADATAYWHANRRVKAVGSSTGTIYGKVSSSSYGAGATTVNFTWDSGSLSNESLTVYASTMQVTGKPIAGESIKGAISTASDITTTANIRATNAVINSDTGSGANIQYGDGSITITQTKSGVSSNNTSSGYSVVVTSGGVNLANTATSWAAISDESMKTDLVPIANGLAKLASLRACTGRYKTDEETTSRSFLIAQDVQAVLPQAVSEGEDGILSLRYTEVIPLLVAALAEAKARIEALEAR